MCSINDDEGGCNNFTLFEKLSLSSLQKCRGCDNKAYVLLRKKDAYCKDCFLLTSTHKFRSALGKSKLMKPNDNVLVAFSGSQASTALLHMLYSGLSEKHHKKFLFKVIVFFIDEGGLFENLNPEIKMKTIDDIKQIVDVYNFPFFTASLSQALDCDNNLKLSSSLDIKNNDDDKLLKLFNNINNITSKEDFLYLLKKKLILKAADELKCNKILTSEVGNDLAVKLFTSFSLGRGDQSSFETSFCDSRVSDCKILRPLRDFLMKEIVFYNKFNNLNYFINRPSFTTGLQSSASIQKLTEKFINNLQNEFSSTVYTIFRTGEKLDINFNEKKKKLICYLCKSEIRNNCGSDYSALLSLEFSRNIVDKNSGNCNSNNCCGSCSDKNDSQKNKNANFKNLFCYGCSAILNDMNDFDNLPKEFIQRAIEQRNKDSMKDQIMEYLIES